MVDKEKLRLYVRKLIESNIKLDSSNLIEESEAEVKILEENKPDAIEVSDEKSS